MNINLTRSLLSATFSFLLALMPLQYVFAENLTKDEERLLCAYQHGEIIRLHIIANSDTSADQKIKLAVRDAITAEFRSGPIQSSCNEVYSYWQGKLDALHKTASETAASLGFFGKISTEAGVFKLPEKHYGNVTLPAGEYKAIRIILGDGKGRNWWCVLYPQLCLSLTQTVDAPHDAYCFSSLRIFSLWVTLPF